MKLSSDVVHCEDEYDCRYDECHEQHREDELEAPLGTVLGHESAQGDEKEHK